MAGFAPPRGVSRREQILTTAARLFARDGFHRVGVADIGAAVGISGPALYRHFAGKDAMLAEMLIGISERLLEGGRSRASSTDDPRAALAALVDFQIEFALDNPELIIVHDRELPSLPPDDRHRVRTLQRAYVEVWAELLGRLDIEHIRARAAAHAVFGLLNSTPHSASGLDRTEMAPLLRGMAVAALRSFDARASAAGDARAPWLTA